MKIIDKKENKIVFSTEMDESLANAIRRYINHIPTLAIDEVEISKNDSPLYDETIAHRLGLIPLKMQKIEKNLPVLNISVNKRGFVYSKELKGNVGVVYGEIPITSLNKDQELELIATLKKGIGKEHAKFCPGLMFYRDILEVKIKNDCPKQVIEKLPKEFLKSNSGRVIIEDPSLCDACEECFEVCKRMGKPECLEITPTGQIVITVESFGQISSEEIFKNSIEALKKDLTEVVKKI